MKQSNLLLLVTTALVFLIEPSKQVTYGLTCSSVGSYCAYNYNCYSTCCSVTTNKCKTLYSGQYKTDPTICYVNPVSFPSQPYCGRSSRTRVSVGTGGFYGVVIAVPGGGIICCVLLIYLVYKKTNLCKKSHDHSSKTVVV